MDPRNVHMRAESLNHWGDPTEAIPFEAVSSVDEQNWLLARQPETMFCNPIKESVLKADVISGLFAFDPLMSQDLARSAKNSF